jgi:hypothetical protein
MALVFGALGMLPLLPSFAMLYGLIGFYLVVSPLSLPVDLFFLALRSLLNDFPESLAFARYFLVFFIAPSLFLWGLLNIQTSARARNRIIIWSCVFCAITAPFGPGLVLCLPIFLCVIAPIARRFKASGKAN